MNKEPEQEFAAFFHAGERPLRLVLIGGFGLEGGRDAAAEALAWAWQHWDEVRTRWMSDLSEAPSSCDSAREELLRQKTSPTCSSACGGRRPSRFFFNWVVANHPEDADIMFDFSVDINPEILSLYETNRARFVEATQTG